MPCFGRYGFYILARDVQAKLALIVAQCLSIHLYICVSVRDSLSHAYVRSIARREPRRLPACQLIINPHHRRQSVGVHGVRTPQFLTFLEKGEGLEGVERKGGKGGKEGGHSVLLPRLTALVVT